MTRRSKTGVVSLVKGVGRHLGAGDPGLGGSTGRLGARSEGPPGRDMCVMFMSV